MKRVALLFAACLSTACATSAPAPQTAAAKGNPLDALEARLLATRSLHLRAHLALGGRRDSHFEGTLLVGTGQKMRIDMDGAVEGHDASVRFLSDGTMMHGKSREHSFDMAPPPGLHDAVVVAFVRLGLMQNVAALSRGKLPEFFDGKVKEKIRVVGLTCLPGEEGSETATAEWSWSLLFDGKKAADERLGSRTRTGLPVRRHATLHLAEGDVDVDENYEDMSVDSG